MKSFKKELAIVAVTLLALPILFIALLPTVIFGGLDPPDTGERELLDDLFVTDHLLLLGALVGFGADRCAFHGGDSVLLVPLLAILGGWKRAA